MKRIFAFLLTFGLIFTCLLAAEENKSEEQKAEYFSAVAMGTGGSVGGRSMGIDIRISGYTTDEEVQELAVLLAEKGQDAFRRRLEKIKKGRISPTGRVGNDLSIVRSFKTDKGRTIRLVTARFMSFFELYQGGRSNDYPFGIIELQVDNEGKGLGAVILGAKLKFNENNVLEIESFGNQNVKLVNVLLWE